MAKPYKSSLLVTSLAFLIQQDVEVVDGFCQHDGVVTALVNGGGNGGNIFAFLEDTPSTPSPTGSGVSALSFLAPPGQPTTPTGGTLSGGLTFMDSPQKPTAGPTANGGFMFSASPEQPLTPASSPAGGGLASLSTEPSLSPREYHGGCAVASFPSPKHARTGSTDSGGLAFFPSPGPPIGHASSPTSPSFVFSASKILAPLVRKSGGGRKKRPRRQQGIVSTLRGSQQAIEPPQKVVKTYASVTAGETSRSSIQSGSSARPCCTFFTSPAKATPANGETSRSSGEQEARKACSEASSSTSPSGSGSTFVPAPAKHSSAGKASKQVHVGGELPWRREEKKTPYLRRQGHEANARGGPRLPRLDRPHPRPSGKGKPHAPHKTAVPSKKKKQLTPALESVKRKGRRHAVDAREEAAIINREEKFKAQYAALMTRVGKKAVEEVGEGEKPRPRRRPTTRRRTSEMRRRSPAADKLALYAGR
ncbi:hypothetical protein TRIUR3_18979 [Triticum urartu]|uniref:Uncharacterized protein n=1 Tax=Triticum urartu TaxID=4572 RepID=M8AE05_TRIUA|nr:hypothetical protein TRIUR3_18979 [Triticum urartu]